MKRLTLATVVAFTFALCGCSGINSSELPAWAKDAYERGTPGQ
jgi:hypothetical protein